MNNEILKRLNELYELNDDWDGDGAIRISEKVYNKSLKFINLLNELKQVIYHIVPGPYGEIMFTLKNDNTTIDINFYNDRDNIVFFPDVGTPKQEVYVEENIDKYLKRLYV